MSGGSPLAMFFSLFAVLSHRGEAVQSRVLLAAFLSLRIPAPRPPDRLLMRGLFSSHPTGLRNFMLP